MGGGDDFMANQSRDKILLKMREGEYKRVVHCMLAQVNVIRSSLVSCESCVSMRGLYTNT